MTAWKPSQLALAWTTACLLVLPLGCSGRGHESGAQPKREHARAASAAQRRLAGATQDLTAERSDLANSAFDVRQLIARACQGVPEPAAAECPITTRTLTSVGDSIDGVVLRITPLAGAAPATAQLVTCYHARVEARAAERGAGPATSVTATQGGTETGTQAGLRLASDVRVRPAPSVDTPASPECLLDIQGLVVEVAQSADHVDVRLTADSDAELVELRRRARDLGHALRVTGR